MKLGIVFYNLGRKGGAERRYYNLICTLAQNQKVYILANSSVFDLWNILGGFNENAIIDCILKDSYQRKDQIIKENLTKKNNTLFKNFLKSIIPKELKSFIKTFGSIINLNISVFRWIVRYKITHINTFQASGILAVLAKLSGCKVVFSYVDYMVENGYPFRWISNQGLRTVVRISDKYDFLSSMIPERMQKMGLNLQSKKIFIPPISFTNFSKFTISLPKKRKIVFSGRLEKIKNPFLALEVAKELSKRKISYTLLMLGDGTLRLDLETYIKANKLSENVRIFHTSKVENELQDALIFLSLQKENNYPSQALLEAMACGCIPIATDVGETRKIVNQDIGYLVSENADKIADIICHVFEKKDLFEKKGFEIREITLKKFSIHQYLEYYHSLFKF